MMTAFHFLRPWWLLSILPLMLFFWFLWRQSLQPSAWAAICDSHLLKDLLQTKGHNRRHLALLSLLISALSMSLSLAGPTWSRLAVPTFKQIQPRVVVMDLSDTMLANDLTPNRLTRAKFKLHDLFKRHDVGQFGLIVYTSEPFVVSPLTDDARTIDALLASLSPEIMPVEGQRLELALKEAGELITNAGFNQGEILVLTGETPSLAAISAAKTLASQQIFTSIMPVLANNNPGPLFQDLATAGKGQLLPFQDTSSDLAQWLASSQFTKKFSQSNENDIPLWRDEGRWFLLPALLFLLPVFRRGWLERISA